MTPITCHTCKPSDGRAGQRRSLLWGVPFGLLVALFSLALCACNGAGDTRLNAAQAVDLQRDGRDDGGPQAASPAAETASGALTVDSSTDGTSEPSPSRATSGIDGTASSSSAARGVSEPAIVASSSSNSVDTTLGSYSSSTSLVVSAHGGLAETAQREIRGVVVDMDSGKPIAGARVALDGRQTTSNSDGSFAMLATVSEGDYITADKEGYIGTKRRIDARLEDGESTCRLELLSLDSDNAPPPAPAG